MKAKVTKLLLALILVGFLLIPPGIIGAPDEPDVEREGPETSERLISASENIKIERADPSEIARALSHVELEGRDLSKARLMNTEPANEYFNANSLMSDFDLQLARPKAAAMETRASDDEQNQNHWDMYNGSLITSTPEQITGTLDMKAVVANSDSIDWYKIEVDTVDPRAPGSIANFTMTLDEYAPSANSQDSLYELRIQDDGSGGTELEHDYIDFLEMTVLHRDYWNGLTFKGGYEFLYDDQDDTDSWTHDGNWTLNWRADLKSEGVQDNNGLGDGLTELNWYYIGLGWNYYGVTGAPTRLPFEIDYKFTISNPTMDSDNVYPNDWKNGTDLGLHKSGMLSSMKDQNDWFQLQGTDYDKIWKVDFWWNRTIPLSLDTLNPWSLTPEIAYIDVWMNFYFLWTTWGEDQIWGNDDDRYRGTMLTYSLYLGGGGFVATDQSGNLITAVDGWMVNNMTGGSSDSRKMYMGVVLESTHLAIDGSGNYIGQYLPAFGAAERYSIDISMAQVPVNTPPEITNITAVSSNAEHETGGNYDDDFDIIVTYTDEDNHPPNELWVEIDPGFGNEPINISALSYEVDKFDKDYTDGKEYMVTFTGRELGADPEFHIVKAWARDKLPAGAIQTPKWSIPKIEENLLRVWNDEPPALNTNFAGFDPIKEDSPTISQPLDNYVDGMFRDAEGFTGFYIWNGSIGDDGDWDVSYDTDLLHIDIVEEYNLWYARITPKHNQHGSATLRFKGYDDYMSVEGVWAIAVNEVNDPPRVISIDLGGDIISVDNGDPLRPIAHLEDEDLLEDEEFTFRIIAEDQDLEGERQDLEYSFVRALSDSWDADVEVTWNTGDVAFTPTNNDVKAKNTKMTFGISDNRDNGEIKLEVYFKVTNVNDPPTITIPSTQQRTFTQFREIRIKPMATDEDPDDTKTFSVNMASAIGGEDSIEDQLPYAELREEVDWGINPLTGEFWFKVDDQNIWKTATGMENQVEITLVLQVKDKAGETATADIVLILTDENEEPNKPVEIFYEIEDEDEETTGIQGLTVNFWVDPVTDPDEDRLRYRWDFGDGQTGEGINVNHTYQKEGPKNVQMWVEDDEFQTDRIAQQIQLEAPKVDNGETPNGNDPEPVNGSEEDDNMLFIIIGIIAAILILALIIGAFIILRKKPAPEAGYYDPAMYGAQGLPPAHSGELPPGPQHGGGLPSGGSPQGLPPAQSQTVVAPPAKGPADNAPKGPGGSTCGNCGSPVDPSWFLCPNCKSPLQ